MIVVDASVLVNAFTDDGEFGATARAALARDAHWAAPEHLLVEAFSSIRGRWLGGRTDQDRAADAMSAIAAAAIDVVSIRSLLTRMWQLRANVSGYDAAYAALAESFECPLVTADARLAAAPGLRCEVHLARPPAATT